MKYISPLLKKFISINDTPENIAKNLILKTCEIEEVHQRTISPSIVIGKITWCEKHPDADRLNVCQVHCGDKGDYQIVCGGANVAVGLYVPVALPGTVFEKLGITIEPRKMRGIESNGMICSKEELGINEDMEKHRIRSLTNDIEDITDIDCGIALREKFSRLESRVMEVDSKSLTNRPDLTGHFGTAVELNAIYWHKIQDTWLKNNKDEKTSSIMNHESWSTFNKIKDYHTQCTPTHIMQILENSTVSSRKVICESEGVHTYTLLQINAIDVQQSSFFSRLQLLDLWSTPINNRVDFSNLFMNVSGQPIHFFDADKVEGDIIVRNAKDGEKFIDLFATEHSLKANDIVITDKNKILALAGVVGWLDSGITETTKNILVEIANFDAVAVRKTGTRLGLRTDAELRYEKNINPRRTLFCLILFLDELHYYEKDLGASTLGGISYYIKDSIQAQKNKMITIDIPTMEQFIFGKTIAGFNQKVEEILTWLGFTWENNWKLAIKNWKIQVVCPLRRGPDDLNIAADIYEDVARIYGYDQIESLPLLTEMKYTAYTDYVALQRKLEDILVRTISCDQTETYPWISEKTLQEFGKNKDSMYSLQNPFNLDAPFLRDDMVYGLLSYTAKNSKFFDSCKLFDIGKIRSKQEEDKGQKIFASEFVHEETQLGAILYQKNIDQRNKDPVLEAKLLITTVAKELELGTIHFEKSALSHYHPKKQARVKLGDTTIGFVGAIHPTVLQAQKIWETSGVVYISLNMTAIINNKQDAAEHIYQYETLQDQIIWRDLCFVVASNNSFEAIISAVNAIPEIEDVEVFDVYAGKNLGDDKKSVSIKIKITWNGNMTTEEINEIMNKAISAAESVGGSLRG